MIDGRTKRCSTCRKVQSIQYFKIMPHSKSPDGWSKSCVPCLEKLQKKRDRQAKVDASAGKMKVKPGGRTTVKVRKKKDLPCNSQGGKKHIIYTPIDNIPWSPGKTLIIDKYTAEALTGR